MTKETEQNEMKVAGNATREDIRHMAEQLEQSLAEYCCNDIIDVAYVLAQITTKVLMPYVVNDGGSPRSRIGAYCEGLARRMDRELAAQQEHSTQTINK